jgi:hypothetical protein
MHLLSCKNNGILCRFGLLVQIVALCLVMTGPGLVAGNTPVPFQGNVTATWDNIFNGLHNPPANFEGGGPVTHMGMTTQSGTLYLQTPDGNLIPGYGSVTIVGSSGDSVRFDYQGVLNAATGEGTGTFQFTGGTGRFAHVSGTGTFDALIDLSFATAQSMTVTLKGSMSY